MGKKLQWIIFHNFFNMESKNKCFQGSKTEVQTKFCKGESKKKQGNSPNRTVSQHMEVSAPMDCEGESLETGILLKSLYK